MRQEIIDAIDVAGPMSIARIGELLGRAPDALYFHVRALLKAGLVVETGRHKQGRHVWTEYDLAARPARLSYGPEVRAEDIARVVDAAVRLGLRDFRRGLGEKDRAAALPGPGRMLWGGRAKGWVTGDRLARVNELISELMEIVRQGKPEAGASPISFSFVLAPSKAKRTASTVHSKSTSVRAGKARRKA